MTKIIARIKIAAQKQEVRTLSQCFEDFIKHCKSKNLSEATIRSYRHHLAKFFQYFGNDTDIILLTQSTIFDYVSHLQEVLNNPTTINTGLKHAMGRARLLNNDQTQVLVLAGYPLNEADVVHYNGKTIIK